MSRIVGHVDGFTGHILRGWLADLDNPVSLGAVILRDEAGRDIAFSTHYYRPDVCRAHHVEGLFGFAVNRDWLGEGSRTITVLTREGKVLPGGKSLALPPPHAEAPSGPLDIFLHLAKTAGTSVRHAITRQMDVAETLFIYPGTAFGVQEHVIPNIPLHQRQRLRLAIGHCSYGVHERLGVPAQYSVFLRDPATRLRSNFAHHGVAHTVFRVAGSTIGLVSAINDGLSEEFDNLMVRVVAGLSRDQRPPNTITSADVDRALHNIREHFKFIGLYETMEESFAGLCEVLGLGPQSLPKENVTPATWMGASGMNAAVRWDTVFERNRHDFALYQAVREAKLVGRLR